MQSGFCPSQSILPYARSDEGMRKEKGYMGYKLSQVENTINIYWYGILCLCFSSEIQSVWLREILPDNAKRVFDSQDMVYNGSYRGDRLYSLRGQMYMSVYEETEADYLHIKNLILSGVLQARRSSNTQSERSGDVYLRSK